MRWGTCIITAVVLSMVLLLASGCATNHKKKTNAPLDGPKQESTTRPAALHYQPSAAGSLVFDPPVTLGAPALDLSREYRNPDAFVAYDAGFITYTYVRTEDRQMGDGSNRYDRYDRRAISTKVGVSYR